MSGRERPLVLLADDEPAQLEQLEILSTHAQYDVLIATNGLEAIQKATNHLPDCILLGITMPMMTGTQVCVALRAAETTRCIPIIFLSATDREAEIIAALDSGANDFVVKPYVPDVLRARIRVALRTNRLHEAMRERHQVLEAQANTDPLTNLYNRRLLFERLLEETSRAKRFDHGLAVLMLDIDHFKAINDTHGHSMGDTVLREVARILKFSTRLYDIVCRYGGDEFTVILPQTRRHDGLIVAERIRRCVQSQIGQMALGLELTASIGLASLPEDGDDSDRLLQAADLALYHAKSAGRNQVKHAIY